MWSGGRGVRDSKPRQIHLRAIKEGNDEAGRRSDRGVPF